MISDSSSGSGSQNSIVPVNSTIINSGDVTLKNAFLNEGGSVLIPTCLPFGSGFFFFFFFKFFY